jgi:(p)ppGpp synthase/HD superfamily hydrolase
MSRSMDTLLEVAIALACESHRGQVDKAGRPYILHPLRLMLGFESTAEQIVAVLHDVVEDSSVTLEHLRELGFEPGIVNAIDALSRRTGESYEDFIERVVADPLATRVKIRDLQDNLTVSRMPGLCDEDLRRVAKYHRALMRLKAAYPR